MAKIGCSGRERVFMGVYYGKYLPSLDTAKAKEEENPRFLEKELCIYNKLSRKTNVIKKLDIKTQTNLLVEPEKSHYLKTILHAVQILLQTLKMFFSFFCDSMLSS